MSADGRRTMIVWTGGEQFIFKNEQVTTLLDLSRRTSTTGQAYRVLELYGSLKEAL